MGPLLVELFSELIKLLLLQLHIASRRVRGLLFQGAMHPLMDPILLRLSWFNELRVDPQHYEPHRQPREPSQGVGGKGGPVVGANPPG